MITTLVPVLLAFSLSSGVFAQKQSETLTCSTQNGFEIEVNTQGRGQGQVNLDNGFFELTGEEFVKLEMAANVFCDNIRVKSLQFSDVESTLTFLCLRPGDTAYYDVPMSCH